jgi:hypothetical protein
MFISTVSEAALAPGSCFISDAESVFIATLKFYLFQQKFKKNRVKFKTNFVALSLFEPFSLS